MRFRTAKDRLLYDLSFDLELKRLVNPKPPQEAHYDPIPLPEIPHHVEIPPIYEDTILHGGAEYDLHLPRHEGDDDHLPGGDEPLFTPLHPMIPPMLMEFPPPSSPSLEDIVMQEPPNPEPPEPMDILDMPYDPMMPF